MILNPVALAVDVVTDAGYPAVVMLHVRPLDLELRVYSEGVHLHIGPGTVEVYVGQQRLASFGLTAVRDWLRFPDAPITTGDVSISRDLCVDSRGRIALTFPGLTRWVLSAADCRAFIDVLACR